MILIEKTRLAFFIFGVVYLITTVSSVGEMQFTDMTLPSGFNHLHYSQTLKFGNQGAWMSGGAACEDFDGDGWLDLYVVQGKDHQNLLYMNQGDGTFVNEARERKVNLVSNGMGAAAADYDNDGDMDLCVINLFPPHFLLINDGNGVFSLDSSTLQKPDRFGTSPSWGDIDGDGLLELMVGQWHFFEKIYGFIQTAEMEN